MSLSFHFNFERCTIMFLPSHSLWLTDASFGSNELKLTRAVWVKYHTRLYLSRLCMYWVCVFARVRENPPKVFLILISPLIKIPSVIIQSSFLSVVTCSQLCPFFSPNEELCINNTLCVMNWNCYKIIICFNRDLKL